MGIVATDAILKTAIELSLEDMRANDWLLDDVFSGFLTCAYLSKKYGQKQIDGAKDWFKSNKISVGLGYVSDRVDLPHVSIILGSQNEKVEMKTLGDASTESIRLTPKQINKPIPYIIKPFVAPYVGGGTVGIDPTMPGFENVAEGMILVEVSTGKGFVITGGTADAIYVDGDPTGEKFAVVPKNAFYVARIEHSFSQANFTVICSAHGDPQSAIWLHDIVLYGLYRYREALLEANGFAETVFTSAALGTNPNLSNDGGEVVWERAITIATQIEQTWVKTPQRLVETINLRQKDGDGYVGGITIASNFDSDLTEDLWYTVKE